MQLLPCPFCNESNIEIKHSGVANWFTFTCTNCSCSFDGDEQGIRWNTRPPTWISIENKKPEEKKLLVFLVGFSIEKNTYLPTFGYWRDDFYGFVPMHEEHANEDTRICYKAKYYQYLPTPPTEIK